MGAFLNAISAADKMEENPPVPFQFGRCLAASSITSGTIKAGATAEKARPRASELASPIQPTNHGMKIPPAFPKAASAANMLAPPSGYRFAVTASIVGHRQLPLNPARTQAVRAQPGCGRLVPSRKKTTVRAHPAAMMRYGFTRFPIAPTTIRPNAIAAEKSNNPVPAISGENPSDSSA